VTGTSAEPSAPSAASRGTLDAEHVLSQLADGVIVADMQMRIVYANVAAAELLGWGDGELPGQDLVAVVPVRLRERHRAGFLRYATTGERRLVGAGAVQLRALRRDGTEVDVDLTLGATEDSSGEALTVATLRDVSTRVALERRLAVTPYLEASLELAHVLQRSSTVDEGLRAALPRSAGTSTGSWRRSGCLRSTRRRCPAWRSGWRRARRSTPSPRRRARRHWSSTPICPAARGRRRARRQH
jgi:PAS domain S-box-containing protein